MSLGGQIVGEAGKFVRQRGTLIAHCVGLDPAGPAFDGGHLDMVIDKADCAIVEVIHSSAADTKTPLSLAELELGTYYKSGHCDFWINCGHDQGPNCTDAKFVDLMGGLKGGGVAYRKGNDLFCSHGRSARAYVEELTGVANYQSVVCLNCEGLEGRHCEGDDSQGTNRFPPRSSCDKDMDVDYLTVM